MTSISSDAEAAEQTAITARTEITSWMREQAAMAEKQAGEAKARATILIGAAQQQSEALFVQMSIIAQTLGRAADVIDSGAWKNAAPKS